MSEEVVVKETFESELTKLINKYSLENFSNTPDFMFANFLIAVMSAYNATLVVRRTWFGIPDSHSEFKLLSEGVKNDGQL